MLMAEHQQYLRHDDWWTDNTSMMSIKIVEGGYCPDTKYEGEMQEKEAQQKTVKVCATTLKA